MRLIKDYPHIEKLLKSKSKEDIIIGFNLLDREFDYEDLVYNFPNKNGTAEIKGRKFYGNYELSAYNNFWMEMKGTFICYMYHDTRPCVVFCPEISEMRIREWRSMHPDREIKL